MSRPVDHWLYKTSPMLWAHEKLGFRSDEKQSEFLDCQRSDIILNWCRQSGKTSCSGIKAANFAIFQDPPNLSLIVSATQRQAGILQKVVLRALQANLKGGRGWRETGKAVDLPVDPLDEGSDIVRCSVLSLELGNGSEVVSVPASADTVRGYSPNLIIMDEASRIRRETYDAVMPMRASKPVQLILTSTPAGRRGFFFTEWFSDDLAWWKSEYDAASCPRISQEFLDREELKMSNAAVFRQEYFLEFVEMAGALFSNEQIDSIFEGFEEAKPLGTVAEDIIVEGEVYGTELCPKCGTVHHPLDSCPAVPWKIPRGA